MPTLSFKGNEVLGLGSLVGQCSICLSGSETSVDASLTATEGIDGTTEKNIF